MPHVINIDSSNSVSHSKANYFNLIVGGACISLGGIGCVLTSPFIFLGGGIGFFAGLLANKNEYEWGLKGARIGSLGTLLLTQFGLDLVNASGGRDSTTLIDHTSELSNQVDAPEFKNQLLGLTPKGNTQEPTPVPTGVESEKIQFEKKSCLLNLPTQRLSKQAKHLYLCF